MTQQQYEDYKRRVAAFFEREKIENLSPVLESESYFSWHRCDCCGTNKGGDRQEASGFNSDEYEIQHYFICDNCVYYTTHGQLDDTTMQDMQ